MATSEDDLTKNGISPKPYSREIQHDYIQHKNKIHGNVWEPNTESNKL